MTKRERDERERRIEAAAKVIFGFASPSRWDTVSGSIRLEYRKRAAEVLDAADEVVPMVSARTTERAGEARSIARIEHVDHQMFGSGC